MTAVGGVGSDREPALEARDLAVSFRLDGGTTLKAVRGVDLALHRGETLGLVGESGSGKSTLARALVRGHEPTSGRILFDNADITELSQRRLRALRPRIQMIFQDPFASIDPRMQVGDILAEPLRVHRRGTKSEIDDRISELLRRVGLGEDARLRYPSQFSGGQLQRISIARALTLEPEVLIADEPVSALDVSIQAQITELLDEVRAEFSLSTLIIAHDLALVHKITDRIAVMYLGEVVERGETDDVVAAPQHPYTAALLSASPVPDPRVERHRDRIVLRGEPPSPVSPPSGCPFHPRCPIARDHCASEAPELRERGRGRPVACHYTGELDASVVEPASAG